MKKILKRSVIKIKKVACLRDLGGLPTMDGKHIKYGLIYKSSHLSKVDEAAKEKLANDLNISKDKYYRLKKQIENEKKKS